MAAGDTTQGRRHDVPPWDLEPGDYTVRVDAKTGERVAWVVTPDGHGPARLEGWDLTEHDDGTITVSPSILANPTPPSQHGQWHGYLERGVWREV